MKFKSIRVALTACAAAVLVAGCAKETEEDEGVDLTKQARAAAAAAGGAKDWTSFAKRKGLADSSLTTPNQRLLAALNKKK